MQRLRVDVVLDVELEMLALPHITHPVQAQTGQRAHDRLTLWVEDLRFWDDVDDHSWHPGEATRARSGRGTLAG